MAVTVQMQIKVMKNKERGYTWTTGLPGLDSFVLWQEWQFHEMNIFLPDLSSSHGIHYKSM